MRKVWSTRERGGNAGSNRGRLPTQSIRLQCLIHATELLPLSLPSLQTGQVVRAVKCLQLGLASRLWPGDTVCVGRETLAIVSFPAVCSSPSTRELVLGGERTAGNETTLASARASLTSDDQ